jgi:hypothetical protein
MSAYIVFAWDKAVNREELDMYDAKVAPTLRTFGLKPLAVMANRWCSKA